MTDHPTRTRNRARDPSFEPIPATDKQLRALAELIREDADPVARERRAEPRHEVDLQIVPMRAQVSGGGLRRCVGAYDLSRNGLAALVRGAPPVDAELRLWLRTRDGEEVEVAARARWIRAVSEQYQAMGVRFEEPIDVERFI